MFIEPSFYVFNKFFEESEYFILSKEETQPTILQLIIFEQQKISMLVLPIIGDRPHTSTCTSSKKNLL